MNKGGSTAGGDQSWRSLQGGRAQRVRTRHADRQRTQALLRAAGVLLVVVAVTAALVWAFVVRSGDGGGSGTEPVTPIQRIVFRTDGVLSRDWVSRRLAIVPGTTLLEVDIFELKRRLEAEGQVRAAAVQREFPADLKVVVQERRPLMRLRLAGADGRTRDRIVAADGTVYDGTGYSERILIQLPYLEPFRRSVGGVFPLAGIERVSELLDLAREQHPEIYRTWTVVSLRRYSGDLTLPGQIIEVRSARVPRILFGAGKDFAMQMDRLSYIMEYLEQNDRPSIEKIDLSLRGAAVVQPSSGRLEAY